MACRIFEATNFAIVPEILVHAYSDGWAIREVPFTYTPRRYGTSNARLLKFGRRSAGSFRYLRALRYSVNCAGYDYRADDSKFLLQRFRQRTRYRHVTELIAGEGPVLDIGCGSSRIIGALPVGSVALGILPNKLRFARRFNTLLVEGR